MKLIELIRALQLRYGNLHSSRCESVKSRSRRWGRPNNSCDCGAGTLTAEMARAIVELEREANADASKPPAAL